MQANIRERARSEGGFTLIELLVVMIIIAILMAVAVPTFLSQKNNALKTQATGNIKQVITAIESCAAQIPTGGYKDTSTGGTLNCGAKLDLEGFEKSLTNLQIQPGPPADANQTQVVLSASGQGYIVQRMIQDSGVPIFFAEIHAANGALLKLCGNVAFTVPSDDPAYTAVGAPVPASKTCKTGKW